MIGAIGAISAYAVSTNAQDIGLTPSGANAVAAFFGPCLLIACYSFRQRLQAQSATDAAELGFIFMALAAALVTAMIFVQVATRIEYGSLVQPNDVGPFFNMVDQVQNALDLAWDVFLSFGTFFFAVAMLRMSLLAGLLSVLGMAVALERDCLTLKRNRRLRGSWRILAD
jgi:hypothetical protein